MKEILLLARRAGRNTGRMPEANMPLFFIPLFFLFVNTGTLGKEVAGAPFLQGQGYAAFVLPVTLLFASSFGGGNSGFVLVTDIESGYFDKLLVAPIRRTSLLVGQLVADFVRMAAVAALLLLAGMLIYDIEMASGLLGAVVLVLLTALFGAVYAGFGQAIALKAKTAQAVNVAGFVFFPLMFLAPNALPRDNLQPWLRETARWNPVTYILEGMRSLVLDGFDTGKLVAALVTIVALGLFFGALSLRALKNFAK